MGIFRGDEGGRIVRLCLWPVVSRCVCHSRWPPSPTSHFFAQPSAVEKGDGGASRVGREGWGRAPGWGKSSGLPRANFGASEVGAPRQGGSHSRPALHKHPIKAPPAGPPRGDASSCPVRLSAPASYHLASRAPGRACMDGAAWRLKLEQTNKFRERLPLYDVNSGLQT